MKADEIITRIKTLGLPVAENEFRKTLTTPLPDAPYIIWYEDGVEAKGGDHVVLFREIKLVIELYTDKIANKEIENKIEKLLHDVKHNKYQALIESEDLVQTAYEITIFEKLPKGLRNYG